MWLVEMLHDVLHIVTASTVAHGVLLIQFSAASIHMLFNVILVYFSYCTASVIGRNL